MLTALIIALVLLATATVAGGALMVASARRRELGGRSHSDQPLLTDGRGELVERGIDDLRVGDVVQYDSRDFLVEGLVSYDEDGHRWSASRIVDAADVRWVIVGLGRAGTRASVRMVKVDPDIELSGYPPEAIDAAGIRFALENRGTASAKLAGDLGDLPGKRTETNLETIERCRWWRYEGPGTDTLVVEQWGGEYRALRGERVPDGVLELIPGS
ncbi:MAG TPA: DUF4178 domain-containing protein [Kofleriaceae bacterium]|nr:DUF4178 domain-containing protein [Kofleriaceae bacterium]